jgi:haloalkane dehalogenase
MTCIPRSCATSFGLVSYLRCASPGDQRSGLFIHGLGCDSWWFPAQHDEHELGFLPWIVPDLLGHGASETPPDSAAYTMESQARALSEIVSAEGVTELVIVGHSMGGPVALRLAEILRREEGARLVGLVLAEGNLDENDAFMSGRVASQPWEAFKSIGWQALLAEQALEPGPGSYLKSLQRTGAFSVWASSVSLVKESRQAITVPLVESIDAPKLFLFGEHNRGAFTSEKLANRLGQVAWVPGAGHAMTEDNSAAFWQLVRTFCSRLE